MAGEVIGLPALLPDLSREGREAGKSFSQTDGAKVFGIFHLY